MMDWEIFFPRVVTLVTVHKAHQLIALALMNTPVYHLMVFRVLLVLWNPEIVSFKIACEKMSDEKSKNLHVQHVIKFCAELKKMVTEIKEMLDEVYESDMSQASIYQWYDECGINWCTWHTRQY